MTEREKILNAYSEHGLNACSGKGGFFIEGRGFVALAQARKETRINEAKQREPRKAISACGDWAWVAAVNGVR